MGNPLNYKPPSHDEKLIAALERLILSVEKNNTVLQAAQQLPMTELETGVDATGAATQLTVRPNTANPVRVRRVVCFIPSGGSGLLVLGTAQIPVGPGTTSMGMWLVLNTDDVRQIQSTVAGTLSLTVMGEQLSRRMMYR